MLSNCEKSNLLQTHIDALKEIVQDDLSVKAFLHELYHTVQKHRHIFTLLNGTVDSFYQEQTNIHLIRQFKNGLRDEIKSQLSNYCSITDLVHDAIDIENFVLTQRNQIICQLCHRIGHSALSCPTINDSAQYYSNVQFKNRTRPYLKKNDSNQPIRLNKSKMFQGTTLTKPVPLTESQYSKYDCDLTKNKNNMSFNDDENVTINNDSSKPALRIKDHKYLQNSNASFEPSEKRNKYESEFSSKLTNDQRDSCSIEYKYIALNSNLNNLTNNDIISKSNGQLTVNPRQKRTRIGSGRFYRPDYNSSRKLFTTDVPNEDSQLHCQLYEEPLYVNQSLQNLPKLPENDDSETNVIEPNLFIIHENSHFIDDPFDENNDILKMDSVTNDSINFCDNEVKKFNHNDSIDNTPMFYDVYAPGDKTVMSNSDFTQITNNLENDATIKDDNLLTQEIEKTKLLKSNNVINSRDNQTNNFENNYIIKSEVVQNIESTSIFKPNVTVPLINNNTIDDDASQNISTDTDNTTILHNNGPDNNGQLKHRYISEIEKTLPITSIDIITFCNSRDDDIPQNTSSDNEPPASNFSYASNNEGINADSNSISNSSCEDTNFFNVYNNIRPAESHIETGIIPITSKLNTQLILNYSSYKLNASQLQITTNLHIANTSNKMLKPKRDIITSYKNPHDHKMHKQLQIYPSSFKRSHVIFPINICIYMNIVTQLIRDVKQNMLKHATNDQLNATLKIMTD